MLKTHSAFKTNLIRVLSVVLLLLFLGIYPNCRKSPAAAEQDFREISNRARKAPTFSISGDVKEIQLDVYEPHFDGSDIAPHKLSSAEWENLKKTLENGVEVENVKNLAISARVQFFDDKGYVISDRGNGTSGLLLYWTSQSGDVYFANKQGWFRVSDRKSVLGALRADQGK